MTRKKNWKEEGNVRIRHSVWTAKIRHSVCEQPKFLTKIPFRLMTLLIHCTSNMADTVHFRTYIGYTWLSEDYITDVSRYLTLMRPQSSCTYSRATSVSRTAVSKTALKANHQLCRSKTSTSYPQYINISYGSQNKYRLLRYTAITDWFLGNFVKLRKASISIVMYACPSVSVRPWWTARLLLDGFWWNLISVYFS